ncbi:MAG TPA: hypothetical protein IGS52_02485 [Oscillatoriaceae cyanobacterium M33_DOE_052]|uniref:Uncharacterized protein n=1 Tax=Planktothricoides sp. SpSt-374 TaxID=2282167 RepID=A0A7C3VG93_9CYAN|nr:hypothetical protein [Oscillatoriaceae cyanobacterium M33_DOE_052]
MMIQGIKRGRNIELSEALDIPDGEMVMVTVQHCKGNLWEAIAQWRSTIDWNEWDDENPWEDVRDRSPGREFSCLMGCRLKIGLSPVSEDGRSQ